MTQQFRPSDDPKWDDKAADKEWAEHRKSMHNLNSMRESDLVPVRRSEYDKLRELRNECLNEVPIKMNQMAENVRHVLTLPESHEMADALTVYGLKLKTMAEEAR